MSAGLIVTVLAPGAMVVGTMKNGSILLNGGRDPQSAGMMDASQMILPVR